MKVRSVQPSDAKQLMELGIQFHKESPFHSRYKFDKDKSFDFMKYLALSEKSCMYACEKDGDIITGFVGGQLRSMYYTHDVYASEAIFYVKPEFRGGRTAILLLRKFEEWAKNNKAKDVELGVVTSIDPEKADRFFKKSGYNYMGANFYKEIM